VSHLRCVNQLYNQKSVLNIWSEQLYIITQVVTAYFGSLLGFRLEEGILSGCHHIAPYAFIPWMSDRHYSYGEEDVGVMRPLGWASLLCI